MTVTTWRTDPAHTDIQFSAKHMMVTTVRGTFHDVQGTIEGRVAEGNRAAGEIVWRGTNSGSLMGMPPTGKPVAVRAVMVIVEEGGKISRMRHYLDVAGMMSQLGRAPGGPV